MEKKIIAFFAENGDPAATAWSQVTNGIESALNLQDMHGRDALVWAETRDEGVEALRAKFPGKSGYPRVIGITCWQDLEKLIVLPENWAVVPPETDENTIRDLLLNRFRVAIRFDKHLVVRAVDDDRALPPPNERFPSLEWTQMTRQTGVNNTRWHELHLERGSSGGVSNAVDFSPWLQASRSLYSDMLAKIHDSFPDLRCICINDVDHYDGRTVAQVSNLERIFRDWHVVFGKRDFKYRRLGHWAGLVKATNQPLARRLNQYCDWDNVCLVLREVIVAQRRKMKGVVTEKQWPISELLKDHSEKGRKKLLHYQPPKRRKKRAGTKAKKVQQGTAEGAAVPQADVPVARAV